MDFKENLLNKVPLKIFSYLCRVPYTPHYEREIARSVNVSIGATNQTLKLLLSLGLVTREKKGQLYLYRVIADSPAVREFKKFENIISLTDLILRMRDVCRKIILYGSCATGEDTNESDIDLFIVTENKTKVLNEIRKETRRLDREIKPVIVRVEEYLAMRNRKEVLLEELNKGIILWEKKT
jgi:predicted nucleotidyltransferase